MSKGPDATPFSMRLDEFEKAHRHQCHTDAQGWLTSCQTLDGKTRRAETVRPCDPEHTMIGQSVRDGGPDGRMGGDARRWPQSLLGTETLRGRSARALEKLMTISRHASDDRALVSHVRRRSGASRVVDVYGRLPADAPVLRIRPASDGLHLDAQLGWALNGSLDLRPGIFKLPLVVGARTTPSASTGRGGFSVVRSTTTEPDADALVLDGTTVNACALLGTRRLVSPPPDEPVDGSGGVEPVERIVREGERYRVRLRSGAMLRWAFERPERASAELTRAALLRIGLGDPNASKRRSRHVPSETRVEVRGATNPRDGRLLRVDLIDASTDATRGEAHLRLANMYRPGAGFVYVTDEGVRTGHPLTHTERTTVNLDCDARMCGRYSNRAADACIASGNGGHDARGTMLALLHGMLRVDRAPASLFIEARHPVWRAQVAMVLKAMPVVDSRGDGARGELGVFGEGRPVELAATPDFEHARLRNEGVRGGSTTAPILPLRIGALDPRFDSSSAFEEGMITPNTIDAAMLRLDSAPKAQVGVRLRLSDGRLLCCPPLPVEWNADVIFTYRGRFWQNVDAPIELRVDEFAPVDPRDRANLLVRASSRLGIVDLSLHRDPRVLLLPRQPIYRCTGILDAPLMYRPFPTESELRSMVAFCESAVSDALFSDA